MSKTKWADCGVVRDDHDLAAPAGVARRALAAVIELLVVVATL